jgi:hypothetical protein|tara:strand:- start:11272 stop:11592 length:321 start_codon:yes stop_codon:yes gene_type:complete
MKKKGNINILADITTSTTAYGYERSPVEEVSIEKSEAGYKSGGGTLDNTTNNGNLILGQNIETDGVIKRENKKLFGVINMGSTMTNPYIKTKIIKGATNSSLYSNG